MLAKFICWLGFHNWLIHSVKIHDEVSVLNAYCSRCSYSLRQNGKLEIE